MVLLKSKLWQMGTRVSSSFQLGLKFLGAWITSTYEKIPPQQHPKLSKTSYKRKVPFPSSCKTLFCFFLLKLFLGFFCFPFLLESSRRSSNNHRNCQRNSITHLQKNNWKYIWVTFLCTDLRFCFVFFFGFANLGIW